MSQWKIQYMHKLPLILLITIFVYMFVRSTCKNKDMNHIKKISPTSNFCSIEVNVDLVLARLSGQERDTVPIWPEFLHLVLDGLSRQGDVQNDVAQTPGGRGVADEWVRASRCGAVQTLQLDTVRVEHKAGVWPALDVLATVSDMDAPLAGLVRLEVSRVHPVALVHWTLELPSSWWIGDHLHLACFGTVTVYLKQKNNNIYWIKLVCKFWPTKLALDCSAIALVFSQCRLNLLTSTSTMDPMAQGSIPW